jgi:hypothetical protein
MFVPPTNPSTATSKGRKSAPVTSTSRQGPNNGVPPVPQQQLSYPTSGQSTTNPTISARNPGTISGGQLTSTPSITPPTANGPLVPPSVTTSLVAEASISPFVVDAGHILAARDIQSSPSPGQRRVLRPLFHVTSSDVVISVIECEVVSGLLAFGLSTGEVYVCRVPTNDSVNDNFEDRWVLQERPILVGRMPSEVSQLAWAAPRGGGGIRPMLHLVCCCSGQCLKVFSNCAGDRLRHRTNTSSSSDQARQSASGWTEEVVEIQDCVAVAWSCGGSGQCSATPGGHISSFTSSSALVQHELALICACTKQRIVVCQRRDDGYGVWAEAHAFSASSTVTAPPTGEGAVATNRRSAASAVVSAVSAGREISSVAVGDCGQGSAVAVGDQEGWLRLYAVMTTTPQPPSSGSATLASLLFQLHHGSLPNQSKTNSVAAVGIVGGIRDVAWGAAQGRSFTPLAYVLGAELVVLLVANSLGALLDPTTPVGTLVGVRHIHLLDEVLKVTWNPSGTRFTTSHSDGTVRVYTVTSNLRDVRHRSNSTAAQQPADDGDTPLTGGCSARLVEKYVVGVGEVGRSVAPYSVDPLERGYL